MIYRLEQAVSHLFVDVYSVLIEAGVLIIREGKIRRENVGLWFNIKTEIEKETDNRIIAEEN